jgi:hypothetical protein
MWREVVPSCTNWTHPCFESEVDLGVRIQDAIACFAVNWVVLHKCHVFYFFEWCIDSTNWYNDTLFIDFIARPIVPRESDAILEFSLIKIHVGIFSELGI